ncbi:MAG: UPF0280 family protein [Methanotrichaceae archaeon]|jgi:ApbE superfamily uncharacterized protein (UPF0280 family)
MPVPIREHYQLRETIATIFAYEQCHIEAAKESIREQRNLLEKFIQADPFFMLTLEPYDLKADNALDIVQQMIKTSAIFGIGPMSAVAGVIAKLAVEAMIEAGALYAIVDNGGDISILNDQTVLVGIYAGTSPIKDLALEIPPRVEPLGICTSSGTVGPSISFGCADAALIVSKDPALADAAATALGNAVQPEAPLAQCFKSIDKPGIDGALVIRGEEMAVWGELPTIRRARVRAERITKG